jgi:hypothetical protein
LLEPQRTNLVLRSEEFNDASWIKSATTVTANSTTSPSGIVNADTLIGDGITNAHFIVSNSITVTSGLSYSVSIYAKKNTNNFIQILTAGGSGGNYANFDLNNGVVGSLGNLFGALPTSSITNAGNGWYRCTIVFISQSTVSTVGVSLISSATSPRAEANSLSTSIFLWGAQLETGAYETSYIPTISASVTRNSDTFALSNVFTNDLISSAGGTWFVELRNNIVRTRDAFGFIGIWKTNPTANSLGLYSSVTGRLVVAKYISSSITPLFTTTTDTIKVAIKWNGATADVFVNGVKVVSATTFAFADMDSTGAGVSGTPLIAFINSMALYNTPISDAECIAITTL